MGTNPSALQSKFFPGIADIPAGDKFRIAQLASDNSGAEQTLLTVASGGGTLQGIVFDPRVSASSYTLTSLKVTVDGEAERELLSTSIVTFIQSGTGAAGSSFYPIGIKFDSSLTVKLSYTGNGVQAYYSVN